MKTIGQGKMETRWAKIRSFGLGLVIAGIVASGTPAYASLTINFTEVGGNVVASGGGYLNQDGLSPVTFSSGSVYGFINPGAGEFVVVPDEYTVLEMNIADLSGPASFGTGSMQAATSVSGDSFGLFYGTSYMYIPAEVYIYGDYTFSVGAIWEDATITSLGLTQGSYTWTWGTEPTSSLTINVVPEPSTYALLGVAGILGLIMLRRGKKPLAAAIN